MKKKSALYFYVHRSSFVRKDIDIFSDYFEVKEFDFELTRKSGIFFKFIQQIIFLLRNGFSSSVIICQFSAYHSFFPAMFGKFLGKKVFIVAGGNDTVSFPSIGYGNFNKSFLRFFTKWSYQFATVILPKHETLWFTPYSFTSGNPEKQGIKAFIPDLKVPYRVIRNGYDGTVFKKIAEKEPRTFLTVTGAMNYGFQKYLKGIDLIIRAAKDFPDCTFTIIGVESENDFPDKTANVRLLRKVQHHDLISYYSKSSFYLQLSMAEGFPNALCESMLCECVPIGSAVFSIPEIIGSTGFLLERRDESLLKDVLQKALSIDVKLLGNAARNRILENYPIEKRHAAFIQLFEEYKLTK